MENRGVSLRRNSRDSFPTDLTDRVRGARWGSSIILAIRPAREWIHNRMCSNERVERSGVSQFDGLSIRVALLSEQGKIEDSLGRSATISSINVSFWGSVWHRVCGGRGGEGGVRNRPGDSRSIDNAVNFRDRYPRGEAHRCVALAQWERRRR